MSLPAMNKRVVLAKRPERGPITPATFKKDAAALKKPGDGEVVVKVELLSIVGDLVHGILGWQEYWVGPARVLEPRPTPEGMEDIDHLGLLGVSGMTAYFGIFDIGRLKDGETVCISGAAGTLTSTPHPNLTHTHTLPQNIPQGWISCSDMDESTALTFPFTSVLNGDNY
ncbi:hypothetical protein CspHIS471_0308670 [Cutaneotrichosporon sp. HIS471]|nr:hypothetical protein CspHIS471_0308670 [Cutaneotrichosporon sp. HIS471]